MRKYLRLTAVFMKLSIMSQLEYRVNFISGVAVETGWMLVKLLYVAVVYRVGVSIGTFTPDHIMIFIGIYVLMTGFYMLYYHNFTGMGKMVQSGELDMYLVKPVSLQFIVTLRQWSFPMFLTNMTAGTILIITGWASCELFAGGWISFFAGVFESADLQPVSDSQSAGFPYGVRRRAG